MNRVLTILIIVLFLWGLKELIGYYGKVKRETEGPSKSETPVAPALPDLPTPQLEQSLQQAMAAGPDAMRTWLEKYGHLAPEPRRAAIELDYAQMLVRSNPMEAKRVYEGVRSRVPATSPVYDRVKKMERAFQ